MQTFAEWLEAKLAERDWNAADLTRASQTADNPRGIDSGLISRWRRPPPLGTVPRTAQTLARLASAFGVSEREVYEAAGLRPDGDARTDEPSKPPRSVQQRHVDQEYDRWMAVMVPRMGTQAAHDAFWDPIVSDARTRRETLERALYAPAEGAVYGADYRPKGRVNRRRREDNNADNRVLSRSERLWSNHLPKAVAVLDRPA